MEEARGASGPLVGEEARQCALPVIDISPFLIDVPRGREQGRAGAVEEQDDKQRVGRAVYEACVDTGFFLISHYQAILPQEKIDRLFSLMHAFFSLPAPLKHSLKGQHNRGYVAFGAENLSTIYPEHNINFEDKDLGDYKEGIDFGTEVDESHPKYGQPFYTPNRWPDEGWLGKEWKEAVLEYFGLASQLGRVLNRIFAVSLGLPESWFEERIGEPLDAGGLELYNKQGQWVAVKPVPQTLVINIGDMMQRWTNDRFKSTLHRVINPSTGKHRFSCPFFFEPGLDCIVECIPTCIDEGETARYPPTRFGDHLLKMYNSTFYVNPSSSPSSSSSSDQPTPTDTIPT